MTRDYSEIVTHAASCDQGIRACARGLTPSITRSTPRACSSDLQG